MCLKLCVMRGQELGGAFEQSMGVLQQFYQAFYEELELSGATSKSDGDVGVAKLKHNLIQQKLAVPLSTPFTPFFFLFSHVRQSWRLPLPRFVVRRSCNQQGVPVKRRCCAICLLSALCHVPHAAPRAAPVLA